MNIDIAQLSFIDQKMRDLLLWIEKRIGVEFTITSMFRIDSKGVHGTLPLRGIDLRMRCQGMGRNVEGVVNDNWMYDPERPHKRCALLHGEGANLHLHLQVHPNTEFTGEL